MKVWFDKKTKLCYVPIYKNANTSYSRVFKENDWIELDYLPKKVKAFFGHIQDPSVRLCKGLAEIASKNPQLLTKYSEILLNIYHDLHVKSLYDQAGHIGVFWIPIDDKRPSEELTTEFLSRHGSDLVIERVRHNQADKRKKKIQDQVKKLLQIDTGGSPKYHELMKYYQRDIELWKDSLEESIKFNEAKTEQKPSLWVRFKRFLIQ